MASKARGRRTLGSGHSPALVIVCGFRGDIANAVANELERGAQFKLGKGAAHSRFRVVATPASVEAGYKPDNIAATLRATMGYVLKRRSESEQKIFVPRFLILAYVPGNGCRALLDAFGVAVHPVELTGPSERWWTDSALAVRATSAALASCWDHLSRRDICREVEANSNRSCVTLPPSNFYVASGETIRQRLVALASQTSSLPSLEALVKYEKRQKKYVPVDARGRDFCVDAQAFHGKFHEAEDPAEAPKQMLERLYRLGHPLRDGFHHDVCRDGQLLRRESFYCSKRGCEIEINGTHANVYPNDFVRPP